MTNVLKVEAVSRSFGDRRVLEDVTFTVEAGRMTGFVGANGAGKTTTMRIMLGVLAADAGEVTWQGVPLNRELRHRFGYLPEERGLYKKMTIRRLLRYYGRLKGASTSRLDASIEDWMRRMELPGLLDRQIETLSKGMSQKVQFVAAVVSNPTLLILDEPFSGLDPVNAQVLKDAVLEMRRRGATVGFSTHDMATAERMCDRIFMIFRGRKVLDGSLESIQNQYGADTVRIRTSAGLSALTDMPEIEAVNDFGQMQEVRVTGDPQVFLARISARTAVYHFEVTRPSLQDIFVRIAKP